MDRIYSTIMDHIYNTIVQDDKEILRQTSTYTEIYKIVKDFVDRYNLQDRKIGSKLGYWVCINCEGQEVDTIGHYFESTIKENLVDHITRKIIQRFESSINELIENKCVIEIDKGL